MDVSQLYSYISATEKTTLPKNRHSVCSVLQLLSQGNSHLENIKVFFILQYMSQKNQILQCQYSFNIEHP